MYVLEKKIAYKEWYVLKIIKRIWQIKLTDQLNTSIKYLFTVDDECEKQI